MLGRKIRAQGRPTASPLAIPGTLRLPELRHRPPASVGDRTGPRRWVQAAEPRLRPQGRARGSAAPGGTANAPRGGQSSPTSTPFPVILNTVLGSECRFRFGEEKGEKKKKITKTTT